MNMILIQALRVKLIYICVLSTFDCMYYTKYKSKNSKIWPFTCEFVGGDVDLVGCFQGFILLHSVCCGFDCSELDKLQVYHMSL